MIVRLRFGLAVIKVISYHKLREGPGGHPQSWTRPQRGAAFEQAPRLEDLSTCLKYLPPR